MKKFVSLFLVAVLMLAVLTSFCGCEKERDKLVGVWNMTLDAKDALQKELTKQGLDEDLLTLTSFDLPMILTLSEDGTYQMKVDEDGMKDTEAQLMEDMRNMVVKIYENMAAQSGMTLDALLEAAGTDLDSAIDEAMTEISESLDLTGAMAEAESAGKWDAVGGHLFMWDEKDEKNEAAYEQYTLDGDTMTWVESVGKDAEEEGAFSPKYPIVLTRAK